MSFLINDGFVERLNVGEATKTSISVAQMWTKLK